MVQDAGATAEAPLQGVVLCCTALAQEVRTKLAEAALQMGGAHKLDLTSDVTHLIVGSIDTPKYRYVAKERPDICALSPTFIDAVREAWMAGDNVDVQALEWQHTLSAFFGLKLCVTGFDDLAERRQLEETIRANGAEYTGDLVRQVTHLIAARPEGAKYTHAKQWGIKVVSHKWLTDSLERRMALDESLYGPETPLDQQGKGAFRTAPRKANLAKRVRDSELAAAGEKDGPRKMRRTASRRLEGQSQDLWKSVSEHDAQVNAAELDVWNEESQTLRADTAVPQPQRNPEIVKAAQSESVNKSDGLFAGFYVVIYGFDARKKDRLVTFLEPNGAVVVESFEEIRAASHNAFFKSPVLLVPHAAPMKLPAVPEGTILVTEWWIERCIQFKQCLDPEEDALSQPHANSLVPSFEKMTISTTGFNSVDLRQTAEVLKMMGATYQEQLQSSTSILVSGSKHVKKDKAFYASKHRIPVVMIDWLWTSLKSKKLACVEQYRISLPAFDSSEYAGTPAASDASPSDTPQLRRLGDSVKRADDFQPKRLSNTRRRHATPSLTMKTSSGSQSHRPSEPSKLSRPGKAEPGPFILEDEHDELESMAISEDQSTSIKAPPTLSQVLPKVLREISPNTSQQRENGGDDWSNEKETSAEALPAQETCSPQFSPRHSHIEENELLPVQQAHKLQENLAEILKRQVASSNSNPTAPAKRKSRPLGRNLSNVSSRSGSVAALPAIPADVLEENSAADGFDYPRAKPALPPSTQLGYDTPEADAHREQMSKKMGTSVLQDEGVGRRVASVGTVKDSSSRSAVGGRAKGRSRTKT